MKKTVGQRKWIILAAVIIVAVICMEVFHMLACYIAWSSWEGTFINYGEKTFSSNEKYLGMIDMDREKVVILSHSGKEISALAMDGEYPDQIALGRNSFFLLYLGRRRGMRELFSMIISPIK